MQEYNHVSIESLNLSKRTYHALSRGGVLTIGNLRDFCTNRDKYRVRNIGNKSFDEIAKALESLNINLSLSVLVEKDTVQVPVYDEDVIKTASQLSIDVLSLPRVIKGALKKNGIKTVLDFLNVIDSDLSNFMCKSVNSHTVTDLHTHACIVTDKLQQVPFWVGEVQRANTKCRSN